MSSDGSQVEFRNFLTNFVPMGWGGGIFQTAMATFFLFFPKTQWERELNILPARGTR